jgi:hypothetical protein
VRLFCVYVILCVGSGLAEPPSKESYRPCKKSRNWKRGQCPTKGCRATNWQTINLFEKGLIMREGQNYLKLEYHCGVLLFVICTFTHILILNLCIFNTASLSIYFILPFQTIISFSL